MLAGIVEEISENVSDQNRKANLQVSHCCDRRQPTWKNCTDLLADTAEVTLEAFWDESDA